ncbi:MAG TPA: hypothetical protein VN600_07455 [Gemmatimonadaceae bacterium]|nr:hypothetical protein [Gemmatimonadaceae bacterium]
MSIVHAHPPRSALRARGSLLAALCLAAAGRGLQAQAHVNPSFVVKSLMVDATSSDRLTDATIVQTAGPEGAVVQVNFATSMPSQMLGRVLEDALLGGRKPSELTVASVDGNTNAVVEGATVATHVQEIRFPVANASAQASTGFSVKLFPAPSRSAPATITPPHLVAGMHPMLQNDFKLTIDQVDCRRVLSLSPIVVSFAGSAKGVGPMQVQPIVIRVGQADLAGFQAWLTSGATRNGSLSFMEPNLATAMLTIQLNGMKVTRIVTSTSNAMYSDVTVTATGVSVAGWKG